MSKQIIWVIKYLVDIVILNIFKQEQEIEEGEVDATKDGARRDRAGKS